jgi:hypothetical protein
MTGPSMNSFLSNTVIVEHPTQTLPGRKAGQRKSFEQKLMECAENMQFLKIVKKGSEYTYDDKVRLTGKTFINSPQLMVLYSCRIIGTYEDIMAFKNTNSSISEEIRRLIDVDIHQKMDKDSYDTDKNIEVYNFTRTATGFTYDKVRSTTFSTLFTSELTYNKMSKDNKKNDKDTRMFCLDRLEVALYLLKTCPEKISKMPIPVKVKTVKSDGLPKENSLVARVRELESSGVWMDVSHCKDNGSGVHGNIRVTPTNAFTFPEISELSRCFYLPTKDTNPKSPTHGINNVGVINFLVYYFKNSTLKTTKTRAECIVMFNDSFKRQKAAVVSSKSTPLMKVRLTDL